MSSTCVPITKPESVAVLGLPLHLHDRYGDWLAARIEAGKSTHLVTLNAEMAMQAQKNPDLAASIQQADLVIPDGSGVVFYLKLRGRHQPRVPGIELAEELLHRANDRGWSVFFFGGQPGIAEAAQGTWQSRYPHLRIVGTHHGYGGDNQEEAVLHQLNHLQPQLILVGLGVPRQELWIYRHRALCPHALWIGVGGSFDVWAGVKQRAPRWCQTYHLEWLYRLYQEPWRWRRMLALPQFAWQALRWKD